MSDETTPTDGADDTDERDERLGALLAVPPLDEITRRRLVRTAVAAAPAGRSRSPRRLAVAVSVAAVVAAGIVVAGVALSDGSGQQPTAAPRASTEPSSRERTAQSSLPATGPQEGGPSPAPATTSALPDLGDVTDPVRLAEQARPTDEDRTGKRAEAGGQCDAQLRGERGLGTLETVGTGTVNGRRVLVVRGSDRDDVVVALAFDPETCEALATAVIR